MTNEESFSVRWRALARTFFKLGATSFGGPAIIGIIQAELQEKRGWLTKERFRVTAAGYSVRRIWRASMSTDGWR